MNMKVILEGNPQDTDFKGVLNAISSYFNGGEITAPPGNILAVETGFKVTNPTTN